jgi:hypothetical protein
MAIHMQAARIIRLLQFLPMVMGFVMVGSGETVLLFVMCPKRVQLGDPNLVLLALQYGLATEVLNCIEEPLTWPSGLLGENKGSPKSVVIITASCGYHPIWRIRSRMIALE